VRIGPHTKKGTEIFDYIFTTNLAKRYAGEIQATSFCSGNSLLPTKKVSISYASSMENADIGHKNGNLFELALIAKAIHMQREFDIFHVNLAIGEHILPLAQFTKKPIVVTLHGVADQKYMSSFFGMYRNLKNVHFVAISNTQKKPSLFPQCRVIHHGIDVEKRFSFDPIGGESIIWTGRAVPDKGLDEVLTITKKLKLKAKAFPIIKSEYIEWLQREVLEKRDVINQITRMNINFNIPRNKLVQEYQHSKVFVFPLRWEEPFGFAVAEAMACGTPVVAYAKGSMVELVKDGETGFLVNPSKDDIRGNYVIKETGIEGMCEAVRRIYALDEQEYRLMRKNTREHVARNFNVDTMVDKYVALYKELLTPSA
jgi:glycosyltransferase involved in cell wall biosynthesis